MSVRARMERFEQALRGRGLKSTSQRDDIARVFFAAGGHRSIEELCAAVRRVNPRVGYATVYRTLKLLKECGLAAERHFDDGQARYEPVEEAQHHDHIICERCGKIVEFTSQELERLQDRIGRFLGFVVGRHRMELYGVCAECREGGRRPARRDRGVHHV
jgi:Fur family ferric uptake transcriptional regulator